MMKFLTVFIFLATIGGVVYYFMTRETKEDVEVTGKILMSKQPSYEINASVASAPLYMAVVKGKIKNNLNKPLANIFIKFTIAGQETSATIFDLAPGQQVEFNTRGVKTTATSPDYDYEGIQYDEASL
ncbi:MAG: hypothetical protein ACHQLA_07050 [Ignavibacteriales bacterium]